MSRKRKPIDTMQEKFWNYIETAICMKLIDLLVGSIERTENAIRFSYGGKRFEVSFKEVTGEEIVD